MTVPDLPGTALSPADRAVADAAVAELDAVIAAGHPAGVAAGLVTGIVAGLGTAPAMVCVDRLIEDAAGPGPAESMPSFVAWMLLVAVLEDVFAAGDDRAATVAAGLPLWVWIDLERHKATFAAQFPTVDDWVGPRVLAGRRWGSRTAAMVADLAGRSRCWCRAGHAATAAEWSAEVWAFVDAASSYRGRVALAEGRFPAASPCRSRRCLVGVGDAMSAEAPVRVLAAARLLTDGVDPVVVWDLSAAVTS